MLDIIVGIIGTASLATIGWAFTTHQKVGQLETGLRSQGNRDEDLKGFIEVQFEDVKDRLGRIEDRMNHA